MYETIDKIFLHPIYIFLVIFVAMPYAGAVIYNGYYVF